MRNEHKYNVITNYHRVYLRLFKLTEAGSSVHKLTTRPFLTIKYDIFGHERLFRRKKKLHKRFSFKIYQFLYGTFRLNEVNITKTKNKKQPSSSFKIRRFWLPTSQCHRWIRPIEHFNELRMCFFYKRIRRFYYLASKTNGLQYQQMFN